MNEKVGILFEALGAEGVLKDAQNIDQAIRKLRGKNVALDFSGSAKSLRQQKDALTNVGKLIDAQKTKIQGLNKVSKGAFKKIGSDTAKAFDQSFKLKKSGQLIDKSTLRKSLGNTKKELSAMGKEMSVALKLTPSIDWKGAFRRGKGVMGGIGTSIETLANGLVQLSRNPITEIFTGLFRQIGSNISSLMNEGFSKSVERFDISRTFPRIMEQMFSDTMGAEKASKKAGQAVEFLKKSVLGLPTGLDEITSEAQRYIAAMGDIDKGSKLAVAANNAFIASFANENDKYLGQRQLQNISQGMELTKLQWNSLAKTMPNAMQAVGKAMGFKTGGAFLKALKSNQISEKQFLDAFIKTGNEGGAIYDMAQEMTDTMSASIENIKNAFARLGEGLFKTIDTALMQTTGKGLPDTIAQVSEQIDVLAGKAQAWVKNNPKKIKEWIEAIRGIDVENLLKGFGEGLLSGIKVIVNALEFFGRHERGIGRILGGSGIWGRIITFAGQMLKGGSFIGGMINVAKEMVKFKKMGNVFRGEGVFSGLFGWLKNFGKIGKVVDKAKPAKTAANVGNLARSLTLAKTNFLKVAMVAGEITMIAGAATSIVGAILGMAKMVEALGKVNIDWQSAGPKLAGFGGFIAALGTISTIIGKTKLGSALTKSFPQIMEAIGVIGAIVTSISGIVTINTWLFKKSSENIKEIADNIGDTIDGIKRIKESSQGFTWDTSALSNLQNAMGEINKLTYKGEGGRYSRQDKKFSENLKEVVDNFTKTIDDFVRLTDSITKIKDLDEGSLKKVETVKQQMSGFYKALADDTTFKLSPTDGGKVDKKATGTFEEMIGDYQETIDSIATIVNTFADMQEKLSQLAIRRKGGGSQLGDLTGYVSSLITSLSTIFDQFEEEFKNTEYSNWKKTGEMGEQVANLQEAIDGIQAIVQTFVSMQENLAALFKADKGGNTKGGDITGYIGDLIDDLSEIFEQFEELFGTDIFTTGDIDAMATKVESLKTALTSIQSIAQLYVDMQKNLAKLGEHQGGFSSGGIGSNFARQIGAQQTNGAGITDGITGLIAHLKVVATALNGIPEVTDQSAKLQAISDSLNKVQELITKLEEIETTLAEKDVEPIINKINTFIQKLSNLGTATGEAGAAGGALMGGGLASVAGQMNLLAGALERVGAAAQTLGSVPSLGLDGVAGALEGIGSKLSEVANKLTSLTAKFNGIGGKWARAIVSGFNSVGVGGKISAKLASAMASKSYFSQGFATGASYALGIAAGLRSVSIPTITPTSSGGVRRGGMRANQGRAKGGLIYASKGALVGFKPKGSDTVPAMLTPGEFVQRKAAVNHFGTKFMERINNLDLPGALNSLSFRAAKLATPNGASVTVNNIRNNNAQVVQHNNVQHTGTALKHANRWVKKL